MKTRRKPQTIGKWKGKSISENFVQLSIKESVNTIRLTNWQGIISTFLRNRAERRCFNNIWPDKKETPVLKIFISFSRLWPLSGSAPQSFSLQLKKIFVAPTRKINKHHQTLIWGQCFDNLYKVDSQNSM